MVFILPSPRTVWTRHHDVPKVGLVTRRGKARDGGLVSTGLDFGNATRKALHRASGTNDDRERMNTSRQTLTWQMALHR